MVTNTNDRPEPGEAAPNPPLPDPGPGDGAHEGDSWEIAKHTEDGSPET